jgi:hypothetical protein
VAFHCCDRTNSKLVDVIAPELYDATNSSCPLYHVVTNLGLQSTREVNLSYTITILTIVDTLVATPNMNRIDDDLSRSRIT